MNELPPPPKVIHPPPSVNMNRDYNIGQQTVGDRPLNITQNVPVVNNQYYAGTSGPPPAPVGKPNQFSEQTEALKKILCINARGNAGGNAVTDNNNGNLENGQDNAQLIKPKGEIMQPEISDVAPKFCGHLPSCFECFSRICSLYNINYAYYNTYTDSGDVICYCKIDIGLRAVTLKSDATKHAMQARDDVACKGIKILNENSSHIPALNPSNSQMPRTKKLTMQRRNCRGTNLETEPMAVSPTNSPPQSGQYLPSFLMGELASPVQDSRTSSHTPSTSYTSRGSRTKLEGPPIVGLFDNSSSSPVGSPSRGQSPQTQPLSPLNSSMSYLDSSIQENQENKQFWVIVYGFPPAQVTQIIGMFSQMGRILEHHYPVNANWVCICYTNQADMRKALSLNGKLLSSKVMIGVFERKYPLGSDSTNITSSPLTNTSLNTSLSNPVTPKIRQLAVSKRYNSMSPGPLPQPDTSFIGKIMDFVSIL